MSRNYLQQNLVVGLLVMFVGAGFSSATTYWVQKSDYVAIVNGERISQLELQRSLEQSRQLLQGKDFPESLLRQTLIQQLVDRNLLLQEARRRQLKVSAQELDVEWQKLLQNTYAGRQDRMQNDLYRQHYTENDFYQELRSRLLVQKVQQELQQAAKLSEAELKNYYQQHLDEFKEPEKIEVQHILIKADHDKAAESEAARKKAQSLLSELAQGVTFKQLAAKYSQDEGSKANGGSLGAFAKGQMEESFETVAWQLKPGEISKAPVKTSYGWHLIQRGPSLPARLKPFKEIKDQLKENLLEQKKQENLQNWLSNQHKSAKIILAPEPKEPAGKSHSEAAPQASASS